MSYSDDGWGDDEVQVEVLKDETPVIQPVQVSIPPRKLEPVVEEVKSGIESLSTGEQTPDSNARDNGWSKMQEMPVDDLSTILTSSIRENDIDVTSPNIERQSFEEDDTTLEDTQGTYGTKTQQTSDVFGKPVFGRNYSANIGAPLENESIKPPSDFNSSGAKPGLGGGNPATCGFGDQKKTSFGTNRVGGGFGVQQLKATGFGGQEAKLTTGADAQHSATASVGAQNSKPSGFGGQQSATASFGGQNSKPSGFGGQHSQNFGSEKPTAVLGYSKTEATFVQKPSFGQSSQTGLTEESKTNSGLFNGHSEFTSGNPSGFGHADGGFGQSRSLQTSGFGKSGAGFGTTSGAFGATQNSGFGSTSFGQNEGFNTDGQQDNRGRGCHNCGEEGHLSRQCPQPRVPNGACRNCGVDGHFSRDCDQPRRPTGPCHNCGQEGHFSKDCQNERVRMEPTEPCRRCGENGHWASECPLRPRDLQGNLLVPYDVVFTPEEDMFSEAVDNDSRIDFDQKVSAYVGASQIPDIASFEAFKMLPTGVHNNLKLMKLNRPTPIQRASFFPILNGSDVVACAHTGCGKTLAFLIPLVIKLSDERHSDERDEKPSPDVLIIAPTRELAGQTFNTARQLTYKTGLTCGLSFGGYSRSSNLQHLNSFGRLNILVSTMGRLQDFLESNELSLDRLKHVVLDEADRMVDSNDFGEQVSKILGSPDERSIQTLLFSASFSENLQREDLPKFVKKGYTMLQVDKFGTANEKIDQQILSVPRSEKRETLCKLLGIDENTYTLLPDARVQKEKTLIFVNSVKFSDSLAAFISSTGASSIAMHSHQNQETRDRILDDFRRGRWFCMVASNVCARGLNISGLDHVINYDMPDIKGFDEYVNRIGRTGRAGYSGLSTAFFDEESDREIVPGLVQVMTAAGKTVPDWLLVLHQQADTGSCQQDDEEW